MDKNREMLPADASAQSVSVPYMSQIITSDVGEEFTLPDYYPEVKRVVTTLCRVLPEAKYDSGDAIEQGGVVAFTVIYLGDDGTLAAAPFSIDYSMSAQHPKSPVGEDVRISADSTVEGVTCRATGPRRLMLKAKVRTAVTGIASLPMECKMTVKDGEATAEEKNSAEKLCCEVQSMSRGWGSVTGSAAGELHEKAGTKLVMCDGEICVNEASPTQNGIIVRGDAVMWCICYSPDGMYCKLSAKQPFEETVVTDTPPAEGARARAWGRSASVSVKKSDDGTLSWEMEYDLEAEWSVCRTSNAVCDMYSTMHKSSVTMAECDAVSLRKCGAGRLTLSGTGKRHGTPGAGEYVIGSYGIVRDERVESAGTRMALTADAQIHVLVCGGGEVEDEIVHLPVRYEFDPDRECTGDVSWRIAANVVECSASVDADSVKATAEVTFAFEVCERTPVKYVSALTLERDEDGSDTGEGVIRICYPDEGENAWDIAKRYRLKYDDIGEVKSDGIVIG